MYHVGMIMICHKKEKRGDQNVNRSTDNYHFVETFC